MFLSTEKALIPFYTLETTTGHRQSYLCFPVHLINIIKDKRVPQSKITYSLERRKTVLITKLSKISAGLQIHFIKSLFCECLHVPHVIGFCHNYVSCQCLSFLKVYCNEIWTIFLLKNIYKKVSCTNIKKNQLIEISFAGTVALNTRTSDDFRELHAGVGVGYSLKLLVGVCRPHLQIQTQVQTKICVRD